MAHSTLPSHVVWVVPVVLAVLTLGGVGNLAGTSTLISDGSNLSPAGGIVGASSTPVLVAPAYLPPSGVHELGPLSPAQPVTVLVGLSSPDASNWTARLDLEYTPGSPSYHRFITATGFETQFAPTLGEYDAALSYFAGRGLQATPSPDRLMLEVTGPASLVEATFHTQFDTFGSPSHWFYSHTTPAFLPGKLPWSGVLGLGNETPILPGPFSAGRGGTPAPPPGTGCPAPGGAFQPCQIQDAYNETPLLNNGTNGTGYRLGVVDTYDGAEPQTRLASDLAKFGATYSINPGTVQYLYPVPTGKNLNSTVTGWGLEEALDLEWARAMAPGASIDMTFAPDASVGLYAAVDWLVAHQSVNVLSLSWGEPDVGAYDQAHCGDACNATSDGTYALLHPVLMEAALEGITVLAASGDCGSADGTDGVATNYPSSDPWVTGVGGTVLSLSSGGGYGSEVGWGGNVSGAVGCHNQGGSGGGFSPFPRPIWQAGPGVPVTPSTRGAPDVTMVGGSPGVTVVEGGSALAVEGTSVGTPMWGGVAAVADSAQHRPLGFLNPSLYSLLRSPDYGRAFHDVTQGWNGYYAGPGWDPVTGIGSPDLGALIPLLNSSVVTPANFSVELFAGPRAGPAPLRTSFNVSLQGGSGHFPLIDVTFGDGAAALAPDGRVNHTYTTPGVFSAQAVAFDGFGNSSVSPLTAVVVGGGALLNVTLNTTEPQPATGAPVTLAATTSGGTAPLRFDFAFGDGTYLNNTTRAAVSHSYGAAGGFCASVVVADSSNPTAGGGSNRVAETVGGASAPDCTPWIQLRATLTASFVEADLPGNFPLRLSESGGAGPVSVRFVSDDPYVTACQCSIFRISGPHTIVAYVNDSLSQEVRTALNVTLYPALVGNFSAGPLTGTAPLSLNFSARASGGHLANASDTKWTFGDGGSAIGAVVNHTYASPGLFTAIATLRDASRGNTSEAFLVDTLSASAHAPLSVSAIIEPASHAPGGATVAARANVAGGDPPYGVSWSFGAFASGFGPDLNESLPVDGCLALGACPLDVNLTVTDSNRTQLRAFLPLGLVGGGRWSALNLTDQFGSTNGSTPFPLSATAAVSGMPSWTLNWSFGDGTTATGTDVQHTYLSPGNYTVVETAADPWGDRMVRTHEVTVDGTAYPALVLSGGPSGSTGVVPWTVFFQANATGGGGAPYSFAWAFGDGNSSSTEDPSHTYTTPGIYDAAVTVTDRVGAMARTTYQLDAYDPVPVHLTLQVAQPVLAGAQVSVQVAAIVACPEVAPSGCNVSQVSVVVAFSSNPARAVADGGPTVTLPPSGSVGVSLLAPEALGTTWVTASVVGPTYTGSTSVQVEVVLVTPVVAAVIGTVLAAVAVGVVVAIVRRRRRVSP